MPKTTVADTHDLSAPDLFGRALSEFRQGNLERAEALLTAVREHDPSHFEGLHLGGLVAARRGKLDGALVLLRQAVQINEAHAGVWYLISRVLTDLARYQEALEASSRALALRPGMAEAALTRAMALARSRLPREALVDLDRAAALGSEDVLLHLTRASVLVDLQRSGEAAASARRALILQPDMAEAHINLGAALYLGGDHGAAAEACREALRLSPANADAHAYLGASLQGLGRLEEAVSSLERAIELHPGHAMAHNALALCLMDLGRLAEARRSCDRSLELQPDRYDAYNTRGLLQNDASLALRDFDDAIALRPDASEPRFNKGVRLLLHGDFPRGWELYEFRPKPPFSNDLDAARLWDGCEDLAGKTFLTYAEQGLGDAIQFCRYAKLIAGLGARVLLRVPSNLRGLLEGLDPNVTVLAFRDRVGSYDRHYPLLSLPRALGTTLQNIPAHVPYLHARRDRLEKWRTRVPAGPGHRVGICWQGNIGRADRGRSFRLREFATIATLPGVQVVSLQKGAGSEQLAEPRSWPVVELGSAFDSETSQSFLDSAAVMELVELIITVDTSVAHLAGALGRPVWVVLQHTPDWRWLLGRDDSPWYPTMQLFRQASAADWPSAFGRVREALQQLMS